MKENGTSPDEKCKCKKPDWEKVNTCPKCIGKPDAKRIEYPMYLSSDHGNIIKHHYYPYRGGFTFGKNNDWGFFTKKKFFKTPKNTNVTYQLTKKPHGIKKHGGIQETIVPDIDGRPLSGRHVRKSIFNKDDGSPQRVEYFQIVGSNIEGMFNGECSNQRCVKSRKSFTDDRENCKACGSTWNKVLSGHLCYTQIMVETDEINKELEEGCWWLHVKKSNNYCWTNKEYTLEIDGVHKPQDFTDLDEPQAEKTDGASPAGATKQIVHELEPRENYGINSKALILESKRKFEEILGDNSVWEDALAKREAHLKASELRRRLGTKHKLRRRLGTKRSCDSPVMWALLQECYAAGYTDEL